jgi:parvulin-like peptidyl-prolyl isomerase
MRFLYFALFCCLLISLHACRASEKSDAQTTNEQSTDGIVGRVGDFAISDDHYRNELLRFYHRTGQAVNLNPEVRRTVVDSRIDRYTTVTYAMKNGWHIEPEAMYRRERIERKVNMEEFERLFIHRNVSVSEQDLRILFNRLNTTLRASHLFFQSRAMADSAYARLNQGESFSDLAREVFRNPALAENGGDIGYFTVDDMDIAFENQAYQLEIGQISEPVKTSRGYSIIKVTDRISTPLLTETQFANTRNRIYPLALDQKKELATRNHMNVILGSFEWDKSAVESLWDQFIDHRDQLVTEFPSSERLLSLMHNDGNKSRIIDQEDFILTESDFWRELYHTPSINKAGITNKDQFFQLAEGIAYRTYALGLLEYHQDYDEHRVQKIIDETFYDYLLGRFDEYLDHKVILTEQQLKSEFHQNKDLYLDPLELNLSEIIVATEQEAEKAWMKLNNGTEFHEVLKQYTIDRQSIDYNGELGFIPIHQFGTMAPILAGIQPGQYAGPFQISSHRFIIFLCNGRREARMVAYEEAVPRVREYLHSREKKRLRQEILEKAKKDFNAHVYVDRLLSLPIEL